MSIIETGSPDPTPVSTPDPVVSAPVVVDPGTEVDIFDDATIDSFPRQYVEKLRGEAASHRTKYAPFRDVFEGADPEVTEYLLSVNQLLLSPDKAAAVTELRDLLKHLDPEGAAAAVVQDKIDEFDPKAPLTYEQFQVIQAKEQAKKDEAAGLDAIHNEAKALSTEWANYDKDADEYGDLASLLFIASHKTKDGDLSKAHALRAERFEKSVNAEVERRLADIKTGARKWAPITATGSTPIEPKDEPKTYADARKRGDSRIARILAG